MTDAADRVEELVGRVVEALGLDLEALEVVEDDDGIRATLHGDELGLFIGRHGTTIDAVQHLAFKIANRDAARDEAIRVTVDAAGYRERREEMLHRQADQAASRAARSGRPVALDAMSATERKVVHEHLKDRDDVETYSEGTEPNRHLVVAPRRSRPRHWLSGVVTLGGKPAVPRSPFHVFRPVKHGAAAAAGTLRAGWTRTTRGSWSACWSPRGTSAATAASRR